MALRSQLKSIGEQSIRPTTMPMKSLFLSLALLAVHCYVVGGVYYRPVFYGGSTVYVVVH